MMKAAGSATGEVVASSLLQKVDPDKPVPRRYSLGMDEFVDKSAYEKENRPLSLPLGRKKKAKVSDLPPSKRPRFEFGEDETYREMSVQYVPKNTKKNNDWAYNNFLSWLDSRNRVNPDDQCPTDLLELPWDVQAMARWLPRYVCETRNTSGGRYPSSTVIALLSGLLCRSRALDPYCPNFLDSKDPHFKEIHSIIDRYFRQLRELGVDAEVKHTSIITKDEEASFGKVVCWV